MFGEDAIVKIVLVEPLADVTAVEGDDPIAATMAGMSSVVKGQGVMLWQIISSVLVVALLCPDSYL